MPSRFTEYPQGLAIVCAAPMMQEALGAKLLRAKAYAEVISPVRTGRYRYGRILVAQSTRTRLVSGVGAKTRKRRRFVELPKGQKGGFRVVIGVRNGRAYARLINETPYAYYLEFGTRYMRRRRILARSIAAIRAT
jgi:hypothetical protein